MHPLWHMHTCALSKNDGFAIAFQYKLKSAPAYLHSCEQCCDMYERSNDEHFVSR